MAHGIIRVTPRSPGSLDITQVDSVNPYNIQVGQSMSFAAPSFTLRIGDNVDCTVLSATTVRVNSILAKPQA